VATLKDSRIDFWNAANLNWIKGTKNLNVVQTNFRLK